MSNENLPKNADDPKNIIQSEVTQPVNDSLPAATPNDSVINYTSAKPVLRPDGTTVRVDEADKEVPYPIIWQ